MRIVREEKTRKEVYERQQARARERAEKEAAAAAAQSQPQVQELADGAPPEAATNGEVPSAEGSSSSLEVPAKYDGDRESSPEPGFVDAKEEVGTPSAESVGP